MYSVSLTGISGRMSVSLRWEKAEHQLIFIGLTGMIDPPRREVREAIAKCRRAGITHRDDYGRSGTSAEAIAQPLGILPAAVSQC